ncbi:MAG: hypothetical protein ABWK05_06575 [Pyrobaculum sp.]
MRFWTLASLLYLHVVAVTLLLTFWLYVAAAAALGLLTAFVITTALVYWLSDRYCKNATALILIGLFLQTLFIMGAVLYKRHTAVGAVLVFVMPPLFLWTASRLFRPRCPPVSLRLYNVVTLLASLLVPLLFYFDPMLDYVTRPTALDALNLAVTKGEVRELGNYFYVDDLEKWVKIVNSINVLGDEAVACRCTGDVCECLGEKSGLFYLATG